MDQAKKFLRFFLGIPLTILAFVFIAKLFFDNRVTIAESFQKMDLLLFIAGILSFSAFFFVKAYIWIQIMQKRGYALPPNPTLYLYGISEAKRYIPGSVFAFIGRVQSHSENIPKKEILKGIGIEAALLVASAFILSLPAISYLLSKTFPQIPTAPIIIAAMLLCGTALFFTKRGSRIIPFFDSLLLYLLSWAFFGVGSLLVGLSLAPLEPAHFSLFLSLFVFSWLIGYVSFIFPMGLGVRELSLVFFLSFFTPVGIATTIAVLGRVGLTIGELFFISISYSLKGAKRHSRYFPKDYFLVIAAAAAVAYFIIFSALSIIKHENLQSGRFDLGNMSQTVWNTSRGNFFQLTNPDGTQQISRLGIHSDFFLILFAPLYLLWSNPAVLLIGQTLFISLGGIFVYLLGKHVIKDGKIAIAFTVSYYLNFWIHNQNLFDFHAVTLATGLLLGAFYYLIRKRYALFSILLFLAVLTKENVFLIASLFGVYIFFKSSRAVGAAISVSSVFAFLFLAGFAIPHFRGTEHFALSYYSYLGDSPVDMVKNLFTSPHLLLSQIFSTETLGYLYKLLLPAGYLSLVSPLFLLFALPELVIYILSSNGNLRMHYYHYGALIVPFIYISAIYSIKRLTSIKMFSIGKKIIFYYVLTFALVSCYLYSPLPGMRHANTNLFNGKDVSTVKKYLMVIPQKASVSASNNIGAHLSHREMIYVAPRGMTIADYIALYRADQDTIQNIDRLYYEEIIADKSVNFYLFKKKTPTACQDCRP